MLALAYRASKDDRPVEGLREGECYPSLETIAKDSGLSRSTVADTLPRLQRMGEIAVERRGHKQRDGRSNLYRISLPLCSSDSPPGGLTGKTDSPPHGRQIVREPDGTSSATRTSVSPPRGPESSENQKSEPSGNRKSGVAGLSGQQVDYEKAKPPTIGDYADIHNCPDPIFAAMAVTRERNKPAWGHWVKVLNRARRDYGTERTDRLFRECVTELYGEMKAGEVRNPGACLNAKLDKVLKKP